MTVRVTAGARLHFGFQNLSLANERLYGGVGVSIDEPTVTVDADRAAQVECGHPTARKYVSRAVDLLGVDGATVSVRKTIPRHIGLGSGTQLALASFTAVAAAWTQDVDVRRFAPKLNRGGRSGVGVAGFENGGFVVDAGHPTARFTVDQPDAGSWQVPPVSIQRAIPEEWRFVVALPSCEPGRSGDSEDESMRSVVQRADPDHADEISRVLGQRLLPALAVGDRETFGAAVGDLDRLNGAWYAGEQGGVYRPPVGTVVDELAADAAVSGAGQSSWGPAVYGITGADEATEAREAAWDALRAADVDGDVLVVGGRNDGATVDRSA